MGYIFCKPSSLRPKKKRSSGRKSFLLVASLVRLRQPLQGLFAWLQVRWPHKHEENNTAKSFPTNRVSPPPLFSGRTVILFTYFSPQSIKGSPLVAGRFLIRRSLAPFLLARRAGVDGIQLRVRSHAVEPSCKGSVCSCNYNCRFVLDLGRRLAGCQPKPSGEQRRWCKDGC